MACHSNKRAVSGQTEPLQECVLAISRRMMTPKTSLFVVVCTHNTGLGDVAGQASMLDLAPLRSR
jgi:hypothetical protein